MRFLLDTNVLSELRKSSGNPQVKAWVRSHRVSDLSISVITVIEIEVGILRKRRTDPRQADALFDWFEAHVLSGFAQRILPLDLDAARRVSGLHVPDQAPQHDALIAGTALARGLTVVTRNVKDFDRTGVPVVNPWEPV